MDAIRPVGPGPVDPLRDARGPSVPATSFKDILRESIEQVNRLQAEADQTLAKLHQGEASPEEVSVAFKKAQVAFESLMQIRDKLVGAFEEIQRMRL